MKRGLWILCTLLISSTLHAASFSASVDRATLYEGETLTLELHTDQAIGSGTPDLSPLEKDFELLGKQQVNQIQSINGQTKTSMVWRISLLPRNTGTLSIPPLEWNAQYSQPITVDVRAQAKSAATTESPVFIEAKVDQEQVYVQAQVILTLRILHRVSLYNDTNLTPLKMDDAHIEQLGAARSYETDIQGVRHGVIELRYAIFPQKSGPLTIPALRFSATVAERTGALGGISFGKQVHLKTPPIVLQVLPKPASYPADAPWLPLQSLRLTQAWTPEPDTLAIGQSATRHIQLIGEGLSAAQLPPVASALPSGLRAYPEQPKLTNKTTESAIVGSREESQALVPMQAGTLTLPAIEVVWWNTRADRLERARLPEQVLSVAANPAIVAPTPITPEASITRAAPAAPVVVPLLWPWQLATALFALTTLLGAWLWWRARYQPAVAINQAGGPSARTLLDELKRACQINDPQQARQALDAWARQQPQTLTDLAATFAPLSVALDELNGALYGTSALRWNGKQLWQAIRNRPIGTVESPATETALPPLYPR